MTTAVDDGDDEEHLLLNYYDWYRCDPHWTDIWSCACDDECPACGARDCSPTESERLIDCGQSQ